MWACSTMASRIWLTDLKLDVLMIDTHPGLNEETLLSIAISDVLVIIMRPDQQDYQGTGVTVEVARKLGVPAMYLVVNKVPQAFNSARSESACRANLQLRGRGRAAPLRRDDDAGQRGHLLSAVSPITPSR